MLLVPAGISAAAATPIKVYVDNELLSFNTDPVQTEGTTLVEFTTVFNALGLTYEWDPVEKSVFGYNEDTYLILTIGDKTAYVNGEEITLNVAPKIVNNKTFVPLRFVGESTGALVDWNQNTRVITIESPVYVPVFENSTLIDATWGMTLSQVKEVMGQQLEISDDTHLYYDGIDIAGYSNFADLTFTNGKLSQIAYIVDVDFSNPQNAVYANYDIYDLLVTEFGAEASDDEIWLDESKENDLFENFGKHILSGALELSTVWELDDAEIALGSALDSEGEPMVYVVVTAKGN